MSVDGEHFPRPFGPYTLKRRIASGGMAELFLGETTGPGGFSKPVVVKMIHGHLGDDPRFVDMFTDEARILAGFVHGNIVPIFDFGKIEGRTYLVMEFIDGVDLETLVETCRTRGIPLPPQVAVWVGVGVAAALHYANSRVGSDGRPLGIVHRDVSPHNILVSRAGEVKLCDFGIAFSALNQGGTDAGVIKGKLRYLSPEQARELPVDGRSDIFSLGVTLYELICGHHPMLDASGVTILRVLSQGDGYRPLSEAAPWLSESLAAVIDRMISFEPDRRQNDSEEVRSQLSGILHSQFASFSPDQLADLVTQVQDEAVRLDHSDQDSKLRAEVASFASEVRSSMTSGGSVGSKARSTRRLVVALGVFLATVGIGAIAIFLYPTDPVITAESDGGVTGGEGVVSGEGDAGASESSATEAGSRVVDAVTFAATEPGDGGSAEGGPEEKTEAIRPRGFGLLVANASPWAEVKIDGRTLGTTPILDLKLSAGRHRAVFSNPETGAVVKRTFVVRPGETTKLIVEMSEK